MTKRFDKGKGRGGEEFGQRGGMVGGRDRPSTLGEMCGVEEHERVLGGLAVSEQCRASNMEKKGGKRCQLKSVVLIAGRVEIECKDVCKEVCKEGCKERVQRRGRGVGGIFFLRGCFGD